MMVRFVKLSLRKRLDNARLTFDELLTAVIEIEGTLNARPLIYMYDEIEKKESSDSITFNLQQAYKIFAEAEENETRGLDM